jgi:hypothetical protein
MGEMRRSFFVKFLISWRVCNVVLPVKVGKECGYSIPALKRTWWNKKSWIREKKFR